MKKLLAVSVIIVGSFLTGCPSISTMGLARTLDHGQGQFGIAPGLYGAAASTATTGGNVMVPQLEIMGRYGVTDNVEIGAKAWFLGASVDGKIGLIRSNGESGIDLAIDPAVSYIGGSTGAASGGSAGVVTLYLPVLVGINLGGHQLVLGPKVVDQIAFASAGGSTGAGNVLYVGSSVGFALKLADNFRILPEVSVLYPLNQASGVQTVLYQAGLGFLFGGYSAAPKAIPTESPVQ